VIQPGRTLIALLSGVVTAAALVWAPHWLLPAPWWLVATGIQVLAPLPFLVRDGVPARYVVRYPALLLLAGLAIPIRVVSRVRRTWYHRLRRQSRTRTIRRTHRDLKQTPPQALRTPGA
jgi:hypothetical protein